MNSWDCFDTLIARRFYDPKTIFDEVGKRIGDSEFKNKRISAEKKSKTKTYEEIYKKLPGIDPNIELELELEHNYPIVENMQKVKDGDLIISDIYHSKDFVEKLLRKCGLDKDVKIITSFDGKKKGWIWNQILEKQKIKNHYGDNYKSDVVSPQNNGINGVHYTRSTFNKLESYIADTNYDLACLSRLVRLSNPYEYSSHKYNLWNDQANYNIPMLTLATLELPDTPIVFTMRDCVFWQPLYEKITGKKSRTLLGSRIAYKYPPLEYYKYFVDLLEDDATIVDLLGSGRSVCNFLLADQFKKLKNNTPLVLYIVKTSEDHSCVRPITHASVNGCSLEKHNSSSLLMCINWDESGPIYKEPCERNIQEAKVQYEANQIALNFINLFKIKKDNTLLTYICESMNGNYTDMHSDWKETKFSFGKWDSRWKKTGKIF